jgi:hypothetical protein
MKWTGRGAPHENSRPSISARTVLLLLAGALVLAYFGGWRVMGGRAAREIERLRRQGEPLRPSELLPKLARGEANAADLYQKAFDAGPTLALDAVTGGTDQRQWTAAEYAAAQAAVKENATYFALLDRASRTETCVLPIDWDSQSPDFSLAARQRTAVRGLRVRAEVQLRQGDADGALASLATSYRMGAQAWQMPTYIGYLVGAALDGIAYADLPRVLDGGTLSPAACRALYEELGTQHPTPALVRALRGERAVGLLAFAAVEAGRQTDAPSVGVQPTLVSRALDAYPRVGKPLWYHDKLAYLTLMETAVRASAEPWKTADPALAASVQGFRGPRAAAAPVTSMLTHSLERSIWIRDRTAAKLGLARIALALKAYQAEHGQYPASLTPVEKAGWPLPRDPFTGKPFHFRREPRGFTIWSTGPDMVDDRGAQSVPSVPQRAPKGGYVAGCDCVLRCDK